MIHMVMVKAPGFCLVLSAPVKKHRIHGIGFDFYGNVFPPARENHFREGTEKVSPVPDLDYQPENSQGIYQVSYKLQGEAPAL